MSCEGCEERAQRFMEFFSRLISRRANPDKPSDTELAQESNDMKDWECPQQ